MPKTARKRQRTQQATRPPTAEPEHPIARELRELGHQDLWPILLARDGAARLLEELPRRFPPETVVTAIRTRPEQRVWELCGLMYLNSNRFHEALPIFEALYLQMIRWQLQTGNWTHKGMPLVWMMDCHVRMNHPAIAKRYAMLTLIEDAIGGHGIVKADTTGIYFRLVWAVGLPFDLPEAELRRYSEEAARIHAAGGMDAYFPEWILSELDQHWMLEVPSVEEISFYRANPLYIEHLMKALGEGTGVALERLAQYLLSVIPGGRAYRRLQSGSTDYDVVCALEGPLLDFRSELGRYFVCECKDWKEPANFPAIAKFCRVLDAAKCRFGILFSQRGITGQARARDAELELIKVYQDRGLVIVVLDEADLKALARGANLIAMLRTAYEKVRLNLTEKEVRSSDISQKPVEVSADRRLAGRASSSVRGKEQPSERPAVKANGGKSLSPNLSARISGVRKGRRR